MKKEVTHDKLKGGLPSSVFRLPSSVFRLPSSVFRLPSSVFYKEHTLRRNFSILAVFLALALAFTACGNPAGPESGPSGPSTGTGPGTGGDTSNLVPITSISLSVPRPVYTFVPFTANMISGAGNFTVTNVSWDTTNTHFQADTRYTITITLTANNGFRFYGIRGENDAYWCLVDNVWRDVNVIINGIQATVVSRSDTQVVISHRFWNTSSIAPWVRSANITGITAPLAGETPVNTVDLGGGTIEVTWEPNHNPFQLGTEYTARVTLSAGTYVGGVDPWDPWSWSGTFTGIDPANATINGQQAVISNNYGHSVTLSYTFPASTLPSWSVTWDLGGGSWEDVQPPSAIPKGTELHEPSQIPTGGGSVFAGWFTNSARTTPASFPITVNDNLTLFAGWAGIANINAQSLPVVMVGYAEQAASSITVQSNSWSHGPTGQLTVALGGTHAGSFTLYTQTIDSLAPGGSGTISVRPNTGLAAGRYTATVNISSGGNIVRSFSIFFLVLPDNLEGRLTMLLGGWLHPLGHSGPHFSVVRTAQSGGSYYITVNADEDVGLMLRDMIGYFNINNVTVTITGAGVPRNIRRSGDGGLFYIGAGATLVLGQNITLVGNNNNTDALVTVGNGGTLVMNNGARITGNTIRTANSLSHVTGGVRVTNGGTFNMNGGEIYRNTGRTATSQVPPWNEGGSGGVRVDNGGTFNMNGGRIINNRGGNGGNGILAAPAGGHGGSGGVLVATGGTFNMRGGEISGNIGGAGGSPHGFSSAGRRGNGGIRVEGAFRISNGTIHGSNAPVALRNTAGGSGSTAGSFAALGGTGTMQRGTFAGTVFNPLGNLTNTNDTVHVINGQLQ